uniref:Uncharacterized protein n=1 Tax=Trichuris muris TaxID=70415 RepID=A0A5S6R525_TRIMR
MKAHPFVRCRCGTAGSRPLDQPLWRLQSRRYFAVGQSRLSVGAGRPLNMSDYCVSAISFCRVYVVCSSKFPVCKLRSEEASCGAPALLCDHLMAAASLEKAVGPLCSLAAPLNIRSSC